jgi:transposase
VHRYNAEGLAGLKNRKAPGRPCRLTAAQKAELAALVEKGPDAEEDNVVRWRCADLKKVALHLDLVARKANDARAGRREILGVFGKFMRLDRADARE